MIFPTFQKFYRLTKRSLVTLVLLIITAVATATSFSPKATYQTCFTPQENCTQKVVDAVSQAKQSVWIQAYSFTSLPILNAVIAAKKRGVDVRVIRDKKTSLSDPANSHVTRTLLQNHISLWLDHRVKIAHNKVIIIDHSLLITGSFNFTKAAQFSNAENILLISDPQIAKTYADNWLYRAGKSTSIKNEAALTRENNPQPAHTHYDDYKKSIAKTLKLARF